MEKFTLFNMIKEYNNHVEHFKDSNDNGDDNLTNKDKKILGIAISLFIALLCIQIVIWVTALVVLIMNKSKLSDNIYWACVALLVVGLFVLPLIAPITVIILVYATRTTNSSKLAFKFY
jgi:hypothetical protein